jgi:hypothetical protein
VNIKHIAVAVSAALETATGIALIGVPSLVIRLLIGAQLSGAGIAVGRVCGIGLLSLGLATWPRKSSATASGTIALFVYNLLTSVYLGYLGGSGDFAGILLWPACFLHGLLMLVLAGPAYRVLRTRQPDDHS